MERRECEYDRKASVDFYKVSLSCVTCGFFNCTIFQKLSFLLPLHDPYVLACSGRKPWASYDQCTSVRIITSFSFIVLAWVLHLELQKAYNYASYCLFIYVQLICNCSMLRFISTPDKVANRYYLGPAPLEEMARLGIRPKLVSFAC